nr:MAG: hypothetical protein [Bacteriophage sp.]
MAGVSVFPSPLAACGNTNADSKPEKRKERTPVPLSLFLPGETAPAYSLQAEKSSPLVMDFAIFQSASRRHQSFLHARHTGNEDNYCMAAGNAINRHTRN